MPPAPRIFISHSHEDNAWCREFVVALQAAGWDVWYDEKGLSGGASWVQVIQRELQAREVFLLVLTPASWASDWVQEELSLAFVTHRHIVPVLHQETPEVSGFLLGRQWIRVVGPSGTAAAQRVDETLRQAASALAPASPAANGASPQPSSSAAAPATLPALGPAPAPSDAVAAPHLTPMSLYQLGFRGYTVAGVEVVLPAVCPILGGIFTMGSDEAQDTEANYDEMPRYPILVESFSIGQYPVTVAEYVCAARAKVVREPPRRAKRTGRGSKFGHHSTNAWITQWSASPGLQNKVPTRSGGSLLQERLPSSHW